MIIPRRTTTLVTAATINLLLPSPWRENECFINQNELCLLGGDGGVDLEHSTSLLAGNLGS